jgi:prepilin-type N-terminal cleavage/methylation domain-containing protein
MMARRGLTLLEVLLALALLAGLLIGVAAWVGSTARASHDVRAPLGWHGAAERVLQLVADDIATGDFVGGTPRMGIIERGLSISTRETLIADRRGPATHRYVYLPQSDRLVLRVRAGAFSTERVLLEGVEAFSCLRDEEANHVTITLTGHGLSLERRYPWT